MALSGADMLTTARTTLEALQRADARAIIQGWDAAIASLALPRTIHHAGPVPHTWLLPQARCLVHHGGFGTTAVAFRAGIPAVVIPHIIDQFIWGQRAYELGVGPQPIPRAKLSTEGLAQALVKATQERAIQSRASELGTRIRADMGIRNAVGLIERALPG
jgi:UDP:flavonoid glycosyltransferase YjiC (YdhE family)